MWSWTTDFTCDPGTLVNSGISLVVYSSLLSMSFSAVEVTKLYDYQII